MQTLLFHHSRLYLGADQATILALQEIKPLPDTGNAASHTLFLPDPPATGASTASGRITVLHPLQRGSGAEARPDTPCTKKNPLSNHIFARLFGITWSAQHKYSPAQLNHGIALSPWFISPLCYYWVPFTHVSLPRPEFRSC